MRTSVKSVFGCLALLPLSSAFGAAFSWTGSGGDSLWNNSGNWNAGVPATNGTADVTIGPASNSTVIFNYNTPGSQINYVSVSVSSDTNYAMTLQKSGTRAMSAGALSLAGFSSTKVTVLDADQDMIASSGLLENYVDLDVASGKTFTISGALTVSEDSNIEKLSAGTVTAGSLVLDNTLGAGDLVFTVSAGTVQTN